MNILNRGYDPAYPIDQLELHPDNPRRGNEDAILASIDCTGFYGAVIVQRSTRRILAGNHRCKAARKAQATTLPVIWLDVTDGQALQILLGDNRTSDLASWNNQQLLEQLKQLAETPAGLAGTGFSERDVETLAKSIESAQMGLEESADREIEKRRREKGSVTCPNCGHVFQPEPGTRVDLS